jgi:hypothetical protein
MKQILLLICLLTCLANVAEAGWGVAPPPNVAIYSTVSISVAPGRWEVPSTNTKLQVAWFKDPNGYWHHQKMATFGRLDSGRDEVSMWGLNFFSIPGIWTGEVIVQTPPIGSNPPSNLYEVIAGPTPILVGEPSPTPTPTPTPSPTVTPSPSPTPTPTIPTPTPTPTSKDRLFK